MPSTPNPKASIRLDPGEVWTEPLLVPADGPVPLVGPGRFQWTFGYRHSWHLGAVEVSEPGYRERWPVANRDDGLVEEFATWCGQRWPLHLVDRPSGTVPATAICQDCVTALGPYRAAGRVPAQIEPISAHVPRDI